MANSNAKNTVLALCKKFNIDPTLIGLSAEIKLEAETKLIDGTMVYSTASEFVVGSDVFTKDADGNPIPAQAGEYTLEDGTMIEVGEDGKISELTPAGQVDMSKEQLIEVIEKLTEQLAAANTKNTELETQLANGKNALAQVSTELSKSKSEIEKLKRQPAFPSVKDKGNVTQKKDVALSANEKPFAQMTLLERIKKNIANINN